MARLSSASRRKLDIAVRDIIIILMLMVFVCTVGTGLHF